MRLGIAYNIFNGDELLIDSLKRLRTVSDYIVLTYQNVSNTGNKSSKNILEELLKIDKYLFDDIVLFEPSISIKAAQNETNKRNLGLKYCKKNNCTHFMSIDCDEFYDIEQFKNAKETIIKHGYKSTACELVNHFHSSKYQMVEHKQYVPFIFKIPIFRKHKLGRKLPVLVDPTRVISRNSFFCFSKEKLTMHHMSYVRENYKSIESKLINSPNKRMFEDIIKPYLKYFNEWTPDQPALNPHQYRRQEKQYIKTVDQPIELSIRYKKSNFL